MQRKGLDLKLSRKGLRLFIEDLDARPLKDRTRLTYVTGIQAMAKELGYPAFERRLILEDCKVYRENTQREVPRKVRQLTAKPITLRDIAMAVVKWRCTAYETQSVKRQRPRVPLSGHQRSRILLASTWSPPHYAGNEPRYPPISQRFPEASNCFERKGLTGTPPLPKSRP